MAIADDILYDAANHRIHGSTSFIAGSTSYTAAAMYAHAIDLEDNASSFVNDEFFTLDANQLTYKTNGDLYFQQELAEHITGASIETSGYTNNIRVLQFNVGGYVNAIAGDIGKAVVGAGADSGVLLDYDNTQRKWWVRVDDPTPVTGDLFDVSEAITITTGTGAGTTTAASVTGEELFGCLQSIGKVANGFSYVYRGTPAALGAKLTSFWAEGNFDGNGDTAPNDYHVNILIKVKEADTLINSGKGILYNRNWGDTFSHATFDLSGGGVTTVALATQTDGGITLTAAQAEDLTDGTTATIAVAYGTYSVDVDDNATPEDYEYQVDSDSRTSPEVYQALQWMVYDGSVTTLNGDPGDAYTNANTASFTDEPGAPLGSLPDGATIIYAQGGYPINPGSGNYQSKDDLGATYSPPAQVIIGFASGTVAGDYGYMAQLTGPAGPIDEAQYTITTATSGGSSVVMSGNLQKDTPTSGAVRLKDVSTNVTRKFRYSSWATNTLTLDTKRTGTAAADAAGTTLVDSGALFETWGIEPGDVIINTTDSGEAEVISVTNETTLVHTKLIGGSGDWDVGGADTYSINGLDQTYVGATDTAHVPFVDGPITGTSLTKSVQFVTPRDCVFKIRNSSPASGNKIKRVRVEAQITSGGGTIPVGRNPETLA